MKPRVCKDCLADEIAYDEWAQESNYGNAYDPGPPPVKPPATVRPLVPDSGGRCATHWRAEKKRRLAQSHRRRVKSQYGLQEGQYEALYEAQGGRCYICARATGKTRRLSVDHDHRTGLVRGLLCRPCNSMLGHARDDLVFFQRAMSYLRHPPAYTAIGKVKPEDGD